MRKRGENSIKLFLILLTICSFTSCGMVSDFVHTIHDFKTERTIGEANLQANSNSLDQYVYQTLSEEEKLTYDQMYECMDQFMDKVPLTTRDENIIKKCYNCLSADYGEKFYWVYGYSTQTYRSKSDGYISGITFSPNYTMSMEEKEKTDEEIEKIYNDWIKDLPQDSDDYTKSKYVYEKLINEVDYVLGAPDNQNIKSVFLNRATVCKGYADAASYFFDKLGIPCTVITGEANDGAHAWNLLELDGDYYYYDVTWGNSTYSNSEIVGKRINYSYLNVTEEDIIKNHEIKVDFPLPECSSYENNYYYKEGLLVDYENYKDFGSKIRERFDEGLSGVSLRFQDEELFNRAFNHLIEEDHFVDYCPGINKITYIQNPEIYTLTIIF